MSKERLEEVKHFVDLINFIPRDSRGMGEMDVVNIREDMQWLIEQAEQVQELEERVFELKARLVIAHQYNDALKMIADDYEKQNKRYREVLEKIKLNIKICGNEEYFPKVVEEVVNEALEGGSNE